MNEVRSMKQNFFLAGGLAALLTGCGTAIPVAPNTALSAQLPPEAALDWLREAPRQGHKAGTASIDICRYGADEAQRWPTMFVTSEVRDYGGEGSLVWGNVALSDRGFHCVAYSRGLNATGANITLIREEVEKTLTALAALGVKVGK